MWTCLVRKLKNISFLDAPVCAERRDGELFGALKHETVSLHCAVDANPELVSFHWTFNNSGEQVEIPPRLDD